MSSYYGAVVSSPFRVRDREAFLDDPTFKAINDNLQSGPYDTSYFEENLDGSFSIGYEGESPSVFIYATEPCKCHKDAGEASAALIAADVKCPECNGYNEIEVEHSVPDLIAKHIKPGTLCRITLSGNRKLALAGGTLYLITEHGFDSIDTVASYDEARYINDEIRDLSRTLAFLQQKT